MGEATAVDTTVASVTLMPNQLPLLMPMLMLVMAMGAMEATVVDMEATEATVVDMVDMEATDTAAESAALMPSPDMAMVDTAADTVDMVDTDTAVKNFICFTFRNPKSPASILANEQVPVTRPKHKLRILTCKS